MSEGINQYSKVLFGFFTQDKGITNTQGMTVNPIVSEIASWYEKLRNAMEYRQDEVLLQTTVRRILKRRILLGGGKDVAAALTRELVWARYLPDGSVTQEMVDQAQKKIFLYLQLKKHIVDQKILKESEANSWMFQLMSSDLENLLNPTPEREAMANYIFHALRPNISIQNETDEQVNVQLFVAIHRNYTRDNIALLRFNLFRQYFGDFNEDSYEHVTKNFKDGYVAIEKAINHPVRYKVSSYVKRFIPPFLILESLLRSQKSNIFALLENQDELSNAILAMCEEKYKGIVSKVRRAIVRSVAFILLSKVFFAFAIEGTFERYVYGNVQWMTLALNIIIPTSLMIIASFFISTPNRQNSLRILSAIKDFIYKDQPKIGHVIHFQDPTKKKASISDIVFNTLWLATFALSFGGILFILEKLHFNIVSQGVFVFFVAIVSFLSYRINQTAHVYTLDNKQSIKTLVADFFFLPVARVGMYLTEGISQVNIFLFLFDFVIETPFKSLFGFFDQWFLYLHNKRDNLE